MYVVIEVIKFHLGIKISNVDSCQEKSEIATGRDAVVKGITKAGKMRRTFVFPIAMHRAES